MEYLQVTKTLANCSAIELITVSSRIIDILKEIIECDAIKEIRNLRPDHSKIDELQSTEEKAQAMVLANREYKKKVNDMALKFLVDNFNVDIIKELVCKACFIEEAELDKYAGFDLLNSFMDILEDKQVLHFFTRAFKTKKTLNT